MSRSLMVMAALAILGGEKGIAGICAAEQAASSARDLDTPAAAARRQSRNERDYYEHLQRKDAIGEHAEWNAEVDLKKAAKKAAKKLLIGKPTGSAE
jgi:hypothetical protein